MSVLETRKLTRTFGAVVAANSIDVRIEQGEIVGVIGANGAGKTTFLNMVTGYLPPSSGEIYYQGNSVLGLAPRQITRLGLERFPPAIHRSGARVQHDRLQDVRAHAAERAEEWNSGRYVSFRPGTGRSALRDFLAALLHRRGGLVVLRNERRAVQRR